MAKYDITYSCGHDGVVSIGGKIDDRDRKLEWYKTEAVCPDCYRKAKDNKGPQVRIDARGKYIITNSYAVKDTLKSRGYRFGNDRAWTYTAADESAFVAEYRWLKDQQWAIIDTPQKVIDTLDQHASK